MRYSYAGFTKDQNGRVIPSATVSVYLEGTTTVATVYEASETMTLDVAPTTAWVVGNTITGATSGATCVISSITSTKIYVTTDQTGPFTLGEVLSNGTTTADQGLANPTFSPGGVNSVTSGSDGSFEFFVDETDYGVDQLFKIVISASVSGVASYSTVTVDNLSIIRSNVTVGAGTLKKWEYQAEALADDATVSLPDATDGFLLMSCNGEAGFWTVMADGTCAKIVGSTNTAATDTDTDLCLYESGTTAIIKNRLGAVGVIRAIYFYN